MKVAGRNTGKKKFPTKWFGPGMDPTKFQIFHRSITSHFTTSVFHIFRFAVKKKRLVG
jgi:hypothetical protein